MLSTLSRHPHGSLPSARGSGRFPPRDLLLDPHEAVPERLAVPSDAVGLPAARRDCRLHVHVDGSGKGVEPVLRQSPVRWTSG